MSDRAFLVNQPEGYPKFSIRPFREEFFFVVATVFSLGDDYNQYVMRDGSLDGVIREEGRYKTVEEAEAAVEACRAIAEKYRCTNRLLLPTVPSNEVSVRTDDPDYHNKMEKQISALIRQLGRMFSWVPANSILFSKAFPHEKGAYRRLVYQYDNTEESAQYAAQLKQNFPTEWDEKAIKWLETDRDMGYVIIGSHPIDEIGVKVGEADWERRNYEQAKVFLSQVDRYILDKEENRRDRDWLHWFRVLYWRATIIEDGQLVKVAMEYYAEDEISKNSLRKLVHHLNRHCRKWDDKALKQLGLS